MTTRRDFLAAAGAAGIAAGAGPRTFGAPKPDMMWAFLVHFGFNSWYDTPLSEAPEDAKPGYKLRCRADHVRFDEEMWREMSVKLPAAGVNTVVVDLAEILKYPRRPELWVKGSWEPEKMQNEIRRLRALGLDVVPKLNFSAAHDNWLHDYNFMVSSKTYLRVVSELIRDVCEIFDGPRLFHIGMDEETYDLQQGYRTAVVRSWQDQWWDDLLHIAGACEKNGARPWMWSDFGWRHYDCFFKRMPKSILQSNWYYGRDFPYDPAFDSSKADITKPRDAVKLRTKFYVDLAKAGYDQIPCGSNWQKANDSWEVNFTRTVKFCAEHVPADGLKGFLMAPWSATTEEGEAKLMESNRILKEGKKAFGRDA